MRVHSGVSPLVLAMAAICAAMVTLVTIEISRATKILDSLEHWSADWRSALLADRARSQHRHIAVVLIDDDTVAALPYRSPVDRGLLARLVTAIGDAGAYVIALDLLFDQPTEQAKDTQLIEAIRASAAPVVLGSVDERVQMRPEQVDYLSKFIAATGAPHGYLNLKYELDGVIRGEAEPSPQTTAAGGSTDSFAQAIARAAGAEVEPPSPRIAWLKAPRDGSDTFMTLPASQLLANGSESDRNLARMLLAGLKGKIVLVGGDLSDHNDRHPTPLSKLVGEPMPGVLIHAQVVAQALDHRQLHRLSPAIEHLLTYAMALTGFLLGWRFRANSWITITIPVILLLVVGAIFLAGFRTIVPFAEPALAWAASAVLGWAAKLFKVWRRFPSYEAS